MTAIVQTMAPAQEKRILICLKTLCGRFLEKHCCSVEVGMTDNDLMCRQGDCSSWLGNPGRVPWKLPGKFSQPEINTWELLFLEL